MAKNIPLTTIGVKVSWAVETIAGTRPATFNVIHGIYSTPDLNLAPSTVDVTAFDDTVFTRKAPVLKDIPDNMEYGVKYGKQFKIDWDAMMAAYNTAKTKNLEMWFCEDIPDDGDAAFKNAYFYTVIPTAFSKPALNANDAIDTTAYATYTGSYVEGDSPSYTKET